MRPFLSLSWVTLLGLVGPALLGAQRPRSTPLPAPITWAAGDTPAMLLHARRYLAHGGRLDGPWGDPTQAGLWGLTVADARRLGLQVDPWVDERLDPYAATRAVRPRFTTAPAPAAPAARARVTQLLALDSLARAWGTPAATLRALNPHLRLGHTPPGRSSFLNLPWPVATLPAPGVAWVRLPPIVDPHPTLLARRLHVPVGVVRHWRTAQGWRVPAVVAWAIHAAPAPIAMTPPPLAATGP